MLIALTGLSGAGKTTVARHLVDRPGLLAADHPSERGGLAADLTLANAAAMADLLRAVDAALATAGEAV